MFPILREYFFDYAQILADTFWENIDYNWEAEERKWEDIG